MDTKYDRNAMARGSKLAMDSVRSILLHNGIDSSGMDIDAQIDAARTFSVPCLHVWDGKYVTGERRKCKLCGGLQ